jgi:hypothetical protein
MKSKANALKVLAAVALFVGVYAGAQQGKNKADVTGKYEGTAKNAAGEVITVTLDLMEKDGAISGTISLGANGDNLVGTWSAGDDGGPVDVKKVGPGGDKKS